jgi:hypothetical protein
MGNTCVVCKKPLGSTLRSRQSVRQPKKVSLEHFEVVIRATARNACGTVVLHDKREDREHELVRHGTTDLPQ